MCEFVLCRAENNNMKMKHIKSEQQTQKRDGKRNEILCDTIVALCSTGTAAIALHIRIYLFTTKLFSICIDGERGKKFSRRNKKRNRETRES